MCVAWSGDCFPSNLVVPKHYSGPEAEIVKECSETDCQMRSFNRTDLWVHSVKQTVSQLTEFS